MWLTERFFAVCGVTPNSVGRVALESTDLGFARRIRLATDAFTEERIPPESIRQVLFPGGAASP